jgi:hypothetical protein
VVLAGLSSLDQLHNIGHVLKPGLAAIAGDIGTAHPTHGRRQSGANRAALIAIWHRPGQGWALGDKATLLSQDGGLNWLWLGVSISTWVRLFSVVWTMKVLARIQAPPAKAALTIDITGKQWWCLVRYLSDQVSRQLTTANETHWRTANKQWEAYRPAVHSVARAASSPSGELR